MPYCFYHTGKQETEVQELTVYSSSVSSSLPLLLEKPQSFKLMLLIGILHNISLLKVY